MRSASAFGSGVTLALAVCGALVADAAHCRENGTFKLLGERISYRAVEALEVECVSVLVVPTRVGIVH